MRPGTEPRGWQPFRRSAARAVVAAVMAAAFVAPVPAASGDLNTVGSLRLFAAGLRYPDPPVPGADSQDTLAAGVARLLLGAELGRGWSLDANLFAELSHLGSQTVGGTLTTAASATSVHRTSALSLNLRDGHATTGRLAVDRLNLQLVRGAVDLRLGRFPVNHSVTGIFAANDFFAPFSATAVNTIYKPGVDAVSVGVDLENLAAIEVTTVLGYTQGNHFSWDRSALLLRANTVGAGFEWAALAGRAAERWIVGGSLQGQLGTFGLRAEAHTGWPDADDAISRDTYLRLVAGIDTTFIWHNASVALECAYLSDGATQPADYHQRAARLFPDDSPYLGRRLVGVTAGAEIIPIVRATTVAVLDVDDHSGLAVFSLAWSAADEVDLVAGLVLPWGDRPQSSSNTSPRPASEFGHLPATLFVEARIFF